MLRLKINPPPHILIILCFLALAGTACQQTVTETPSEPHPLPSASPTIRPTASPTPKPTQSTTSQGISPNTVPEGSFYFEVFDQNPLYSNENDFVQWNFSASDTSFTLIGTDMAGALTLRLPMTIETGRFDLQPMSTTAFQAPSGSLLLHQRVFYFTGGTINIDEVDEKILTGSLEFTAVDIADPSIVVNGFAVLHRTPLGYQEDTEPGTLLRQWAQSAAASSELPGHAALMASGKSDTIFDCGEVSTAWVPAADAGSEWLELYYDQPVRPTVLNILTTNLPGAVQQVNLLGQQDFYPLDMSAVEFIDGCPSALAFYIDGEIPFDIYGVQIIFEYAESGMRPAIDAVELVGTRVSEPANPADDILTSWASAAEATTEDASIEAVAMAAAGAPDTPICGSFGTAWKPGLAEYPAQLTLYYYDQPLIPTELRIVISNHPSQVIKVEVLDAYGEHPEVVVYESSPQTILECPFMLVIPVQGIDYLVMGVRISLQRAALPANDTEIDAVMLVGHPQ